MYNRVFRRLQECPEQDASAQKIPDKNRNRLIDNREQTTGYQREGEQDG